MAFYDTHWYCNFGDGSTTGYYAVAKRPQNAAVAAGQLCRQFTTPSVGNERVFVCRTAGTTANTTDATWTLTRGAGTTDGTATWQECTGMAAVNGDIINTPSWAEVKALGTSPSLGVIIKRNNLASYQCCTAAGTLGTSEPAFSDTAGTSTTESGGTAGWRSLGPVSNFTGGQAPHARLTNAFASGWFTSGNTVYVGNNHAETAAAGIAFTVASALLAKIICHNRLGSYPPASSDMTTGATITATGSNVAFSAQGSFYFYGITFVSLAGITIGASAVGQTQNWYCFDNCSLQTTASGANWTVGASSTAWGVVVFNNTTVKFVGTTSYIAPYFVNLIWQNTGQVLASGSAVPTTLFQLTGSSGRFNTITLRNLDLSQLTGSLFTNASNSSIGSLIVQDCKLNAAMTVTTPINSGMNVQLIRSDSAATAYKSTRYQYEGTETTETSIVRTDGAVDPTGQAQSRKILTSANAQWLRPFKAEPMAIWNDDVESPVTVTVCGTVNAGALPNNDDIWLETEYLGDAAVTGDAYWSNTKLLMGFEGADAATGAPGMTDESSAARGTASVIGNAQIDTAQKPFGTSSLLLDGSGDLVTFPDSADFHLSNQPFTIELQIRPASVSGIQFFISQWLSPNNGWALYYESGTLKFHVSTTGSNDLTVIDVAGSVLVANTWQAICVDFDGTKYRMYRNGVMIGSSTTLYTIFNSADGLYIGQMSGAFSFYYNGWMKEIRLTAGVARYASDAGYTVATSAFPRGATTTVSPKGTIVTTTKSNVLASNAAVASDGSVWAGTGTPAFPSSVTGVIGWWDASVPASLSLTGSTINSVADQSGAGNTMTGIGTTKPTYNAAEVNLNSRPAFVFGGSAHGAALYKDPFPMGTGNTLTIWYVGIWNSTGSSNNARIMTYERLGADWDSVTKWGVYRSGASTTTISIIRNTNTASGNNAFNALRRVIITISSSGAMTVYVDGTAYTPVTLAGNWANGGKLGLGGYTGEGTYSSGSFGEFGVATDYSNAAAVAQLDAYLAIKWGPLWSPFKLASTITPQLPGYIHARVRAGKASATYYVDPKVAVAPYVWSPTALTGLVGWWDASVTASLSLTGSSINSVADQSGLGNTMNWETAKPTYSATGFNSTKPAMVFSSAGVNVLKATSFPMSSGNTLTLWLVTTMGATGTQGYGRYFSYLGGSGGVDYGSPTSWLFAQNSASSTQCVLYRNSTTAVATTTAYPAPHRLIATIKSDGSFTVYVDGVSAGTAASGGNWSDAGTLRIGNDPGLASQFAGPIAECGVATGYSDATTVAALDTYLKNKWGL